MVVRADGLEADRKQVIHRQHAGGRLPPPVTEGFDRPDPAPGEILGHRLHQHPADAAAGELAEQMGRHEQHSVGAHRAGGKGYRAGNVLRRREEHVPGRDAVDIGNLAAASPLEQDRRNPRLLLEFRVAVFFGPRPADRPELPEDA
jgi:hypothetical protein